MNFGYMTPEEENDPHYQVGGSHYSKKKIQPWDACAEWFDRPHEFEGYLRGNVIKYMARYPHKGGREDVLKAQHYLTKLLEVLE